MISPKVEYFPHNLPFRHHNLAQALSQNIYRPSPIIGTVKIPKAQIIE